MCNRYQTTGRVAIAGQWNVEVDGYAEWLPSIGPWQKGPFIRLKAGEPELVVGQWALIGDDDKKAISKPRMTNNARFDTIAQLRTYRGPWSRGQRCVIPAFAYDEPNWETGKNVWWSLRRADGHPWHLAGIWNAWTDPATGEIVESYSMVTTNADDHPLLRRLHRPDLSRPLDKQDKRAVVPIEVDDLPAWLDGSIEQASALVRLPDPAAFVAGPSIPTTAIRSQARGPAALTLF